MGTFNKLRQWINRDDGRVFQVGNDVVSVTAVVCVIVAIGALVFWQVWQIGF